MPGYAIVITATDKVTGTLDAINEKMVAFNKRIAAINAPFRRMGDSFQKLVKTTGLDKIATGFRDVAKGGLDAFRSLMRVIEPLAAITGAASLAGVYKLSQAWGQFGLHTTQTAQRANLTTDAMQSLNNAGRLAGVSADTMAQSMATLADNMSSSRFTASPFTVALRAMHLDVDKLRQQNPTEQLKTISDALAGVHDVATRAYLTREIFGGEGMIPFLNKMSGGIADLIAKADKYGHVTGAQLKAADDFRQANEGVSLSVENLGWAIASVVGPAMTPFLNDLSAAIGHMNTWIDANHVWLQNKISEEMHKVVTALVGINWSAVGVDILDVVHFLETGADALGGWVAVGKDVLTFMAVKWFIGMAVPIVRVIALMRSMNAVLAEGGAAGGLLGLLGKLTGAATALAVAYGLWKGLDALETATAPAGDGQANLAHNMLFDMNPLHWTPNYHADGQGPQQKGVAKETADVKAVSNDTMDYLTKTLHWSRRQAAGGVGNFLAEDPTGQPDLQGDLNPLTGQYEAIGRMQWHQDRRKRIEDHFKKKMGEMSRHEQLDAADWEVRTYYSDAFKAMDKAGSDSDAGAIFSRDIERPGVTDAQKLLEMQHRGMNAEMVGKDYAAAQGEDAALPTAAAPGAPGTSGKVDLNVKVTGQPAQVTTRTSGPINVAHSGLTGY